MFLLCQQVRRTGFLEYAAYETVAVSRLALCVYRWQDPVYHRFTEMITHDNNCLLHSHFQVYKIYQMNTLIR